jgi:hypothetical protein
VAPFRAGYEARSAGPVRAYCSAPVVRNKPPLIGLSFGWGPERTPVPPLIKETPKSPRNLEVRSPAGDIRDSFRGRLHRGMVRHKKLAWLARATGSRNGAAAASVGAQGSVRKSGTKMP